MTKLLTFITLCSVFVISYATPAKSTEFTSRTSIKMCIYTEKLENEESWEIYYLQDIPRNESCSYPPKPAVLEGKSFAYEYSVDGIDYYSGITSGGEKCLIKRRSIIISD